MPTSRSIRFLVPCALAALIVASPAAAAPGTTYRIGSVTGIETVQLNGPTTLAGAPATLALKMVVRWKAGPSGSFGTATISRNPPSGQKRLCASNTCPAYGPMVGTATITGSVTPTAGGAAVSCRSSKTLKAAFGQGSSNLVRTLEIYKKGAKRVVTVAPSEYSYLMQSTVPDSSCRALLDETALRTAITVPFPVAKLGNATLSLAFRKTVPVAVPAGSVGAGIKGSVKVNIAATLKRV